MGEWVYGGQCEERAKCVWMQSVRQGKHGKSSREDKSWGRKRQRRCGKGWMGMGCRDEEHTFGVTCPASRVWLRMIGPTTRKTRESALAATTCSLANRWVMLGMGAINTWREGKKGNENGQGLWEGEWEKGTGKGCESVWVEKKSRRNQSHEPVSNNKMHINVEIRWVPAMP